MTISISKLTELPGSVSYIACVLYISEQTWGTFTTTNADVFRTEQAATDWLTKQKQARCVIWSNVSKYTCTQTQHEIQQGLIVGLTQERHHMQEEMAKQLTEIDERISNLLAISHQPTPAAPPNASQWTEPLAVSPKMDFIRAVLEQIEKTFKLHDEAPWVYFDEEGEKTACDSIGDLLGCLWSCDFEAIQVLLSSEDYLTLQLVWCNTAPEVLSDYGASTDGLLATLNALINDATKEAGYE